MKKFTTTTTMAMALCFGVLGVSVAYAARPLKVTAILATPFASPAEMDADGMAIMVATGNGIHVTITLSGLLPNTNYTVRPTGTMNNFQVTTNNAGHATMSANGFAQLPTSFCVNVTRDGSSIASGCSNDMPM